MFPLQSVLFPSVVLPLHVFEPRYRALMRDCMARDREFGVTLIERGSEVGGGDIRCWTGTRARIAQAAELPDGRWAMVAVGTRRLRVARWLPDDPYPLAEVDDLDEPAPGAGAGATLERATALLRRALAVKVELGEPAAEATTGLSDDLVMASFQVAALAPFGPADAQRVLDARGPDERLRLLVELLDAEVEFLEARLLAG